MQKLLVDSYKDHLASFISGEEEGFNYFFNTYYKAVYFFACKYVKENAAAEDIVENSFIKLWEKRERMESEAGLKGYLYKTVYNACLRWNSRQSMVDRRQKEIVYLSETVEKDCLENIIRAETLRRVKEAMEELPAGLRKVFVKLFVEGKSIVKAAAELKVAVSTVKNQKARGIKLLRMKLTSLFFLF